MNRKRTLVLAVTLAMLVSALSFAPAASARVYVTGPGIVVHGGPPPLRHEVLIPRPGRATSGSPATGTGTTPATTSGWAATGCCRRIRAPSGSGRGSSTAITSATSTAATGAASLPSPSRS